MTAIAGGKGMFPWRLLTRDVDSVIEDAATGQVIARFPHALEIIASHPASRKWAGSVSNHVFIIALEGQPEIGLGVNKQPQDS